MTLLNRRAVASALILLALAALVPLMQPIAKAAGPPYLWTGLTDVAPHLGQDNLPTAMQARNGSLWLSWQTFRYRNTVPDIAYCILNVTTNLCNSNGVGRTTSSGYNTSPALAQLGNGTIMLFWSQRQTNAFNLHYARFSVTQLGIGTWLSSPPLTTLTNFNDTAPAATVGADGTLWLFWERSNQSCTTTCSQTKQIYYETLKSGSWSSPTKITTDNTNWNSLPSAVVTKDGLVRLAWTKGGQGNGASSIYYKTFNGSVWSIETPIVSPPTGFGDQRPSMIQDRNGTIWLFWSRSSISAPSFDIYSKFSVDNGHTLNSTLTETKMTSEAAGIDSQQPAAVQGNSVSDKTIHLFYSSDRVGFDYDIWSLLSSSVSPVHDLGLTFVSPSVSIMYAGGMASIGQSSNTTVAVTVVNYGDFGENANATVTVSNSTVISLGSQIQPVNRAGSVSFIFSWNTTGAKPGRYNISVSAFSTNGTETPGNRGDNNVNIKNSVWLLPWGDVDQDGNVVLGDVSVFFYDFGFTPATPARWNPFCDINNNGIIDIIDVGVAVKNFGIYT